MNLPEEIKSQNRLTINIWNADVQLSDCTLKKYYFRILTLAINTTAFCSLLRIKGLASKQNPNATHTQTPPRTSLKPSVLLHSHETGPHSARTAGIVLWYYFCTCLSDFLLGLASRDLQPCGFPSDLFKFEVDRIWHCPCLPWTAQSWKLLAYFSYKSQTTNWTAKRAQLHSFRINSTLSSLHPWQLASPNMMIQFSSQF